MSDQDNTTPLRLPSPANVTKTRLVLVADEPELASPELKKLTEALEGMGAEIIALPMVPPPESPRPDSPSSWTEVTKELGAYARDFLKAFRAPAPSSEDAPTGPQTATTSPFTPGSIDALIIPKAHWAKSFFSSSDPALAQATRIGLSPTYHTEQAWSQAEFDALIVPHPAAGELPRIREGRANLFIGGPLVADEKPRSLPGADAQVVISLARLSPADVDPLLFQLSLAKPERFSLLFLPSGRPGVDELIRARAGHYGLEGRRPRSQADNGAWIRGASVLVGLPSPEEMAIAASAEVPLLLIGSPQQLTDADRRFIGQGALWSEIPITISVHLESLLPEGAARAEAIQALKDLESHGISGVAHAIMSAVQAGRRISAPLEGPRPIAEEDDGLEVIGGDAPISQGPRDAMPIPLRRAYLKEIILRQKEIERNLGRAEAGLERWQKRVRLARSSGAHALADEAMPRVEGLMKVISQLQREKNEVMALRDLYASKRNLSEADRAAVLRFASPTMASSLDPHEGTDAAFTQLEIEAALKALKSRIDPNT